ncbi:MAG: CoA transferase [Acidimicrobiales bacterium]|nr:CoA transferase [Acidimicrobiales bacterium]MCB9393287.1 CoA transferase [Acidimicrobiaceae bacterium]
MTPGSRRVTLCQLDAWGGPQRGPRSDHSGYDDLVQAATGVMERFGGSLDTVEEHAHFGTIDVLGGLCAAYAISLALHRREQTGRGGTARTSLAAAGQWLQCRYMYDHADRAPFDEPRGREAKGEGALHRCYPATDGWFFLAAPTIERRPALVLVAGRRPPTRDLRCAPRCDGAVRRVARPPRRPRRTPRAANRDPSHQRADRDAETVRAVRREHPPNPQRARLHRAGDRDDDHGSRRLGTLDRRVPPQLSAA